MTKENLSYFLCNKRSVFIRQTGALLKFDDSESWVIRNPIELQIKAKVEAVGTPLKDWNVNIYRGVLTGLNEAFIIDGEKRDAIIAEDPKSAEVIRPILRGRDVKKYTYEFADLYLISTFPSLKIDIDNYPAIKQHLLRFGFDRLKQTGDPGARKKTNNEWFETQDSISYSDDFYRQKIVWGEISDTTKFCIDIKGDFVTEATTFLMTGNSLLYLLAFLNSKLSEHLFSKIGTTTGVGTIRWKKYTIEQLLVPAISPEREALYESIVNDILQRQTQNQDYKDLLSKIDMMIYTELQLTQEEIEFIEIQ